MTSNCIGRGMTSTMTSNCVDGGMTKENEDTSLNFKWIRKRGVGGKKKEIQFYESFIYDDVEYTLYDCVYMHKEGYPKPYIGKLVKIWDIGGMSKKVKVQWFFYVWEILNYLGDKKALDKEIFLASGEGSGLANVNPLEAIAGKCNVVCISKDSRNAQPSAKELEAADYIFYRTFDVDRCTILDEMDDKVGGIEIKYVFNRKESNNASSVPNLKSETKKDTKNTTGSDEKLQLSSKNIPTKYNTLKIDGNCKQSVGNVNAEKEVARDVNDLLVKKAPAGVDTSSEGGVATSDGAVMNVDIAITSRCEPSKTLHLTSDDLTDKLKTSKTYGKSNQSGVKMNLKRKVIARDVNDSLVRRESLAGVELASGAGEGTSAVAATSVEVGKSFQLKVDSNNDKAKVSKVSTDQVEVKQRPKSSPDSDSSLVGREFLAGVELASGAGEVRSVVAATSVEVGKATQMRVDSNNDNAKVSKVSPNQVEVKPRANSAQNSDNLGDRSGKKANGVNSIKLLKDEKLIARDVNGLLVGRESLAGVDPASGAGEDTNDVATSSVDIGKTTQVSVYSNNDKAKVSKVSTNPIEVKSRAKSARDSDSLEDRSGKKVKGANSIKLPKDEKLNFKDKLPVQQNDAKDSITTFTKEENAISGNVKDSPRIGHIEKFAKYSVDLEGRPSKKAKVDSSLELYEGKNRNINQKLNPNCDGNNAKDTKAANISSKERDESIIAPDFLVMKKEPKEQPDEKARKFYNGILPVADEENKCAHQKFEVPRRPDVEKSSWFRQQPWEERLQTAYKHGTLLLLLNLDPEYTSGEVDDIIWHAFKEICTAKMVQHTAISSPSSGQALVIFKTREATEKVLRKLDTDCLVLSNGRVVAGCTSPPLNLSEKQSTFFGHIVIDKIKLQMQREMKEAVSTSHCSQPNTIEYEMAMDWCALQTRSEKWWRKLHKQQQQEMTILENNLKK